MFQTRKTFVHPQNAQYIFFKSESFLTLHTAMELPHSRPKKGSKSIFKIVHVTSEKTDTEEKHCWIKSLFLFSLCTKSILIAALNYSWTTDITWTILWCPYNHSGPWMCQLHCCLWRVRKLSDFIKKYLNLCLICIADPLKMNEWHEGE